MQEKIVSCHCKNFKLKVKSDFKEGVVCNCSICTKKGFIHHFVEKEQVEFISDINTLSDYQFNTKIAHHFFCKTCGMAPLYIPRSHPDGYSVNLRCVDDFDLSTASLKNFDGQNWEKNIEGLKS